MATNIGNVIGNVVVKLRADISQFIKDLRDAGSEAKTTLLGKIGSGLKLGGKAIAGAVATSFTAAIGIASSQMDSAVSRMDTLNNFPKVMSNLNISQEESQAAIDKMSESLTGLPTTLDDAALAVQRFTSKNQDVEQSTDMFLALNNAILAGGASADIQASALEQISQAYAKGKPDMLEWRTLMTAMPAQLTQVAQAMGGISTDELGEKLRSGEISMDDFMQQVMRMNTEGVEGFKSFEEQARNATNGLGTQIQTLKTSVTKVMADAFNGKDMTKSLDQLIQRASNVIPQVARGILAGAGQLMKMIPQIFQMIQDVLAELWPELVNQLITLALQLVDYLPQFIMILWTMLQQLGLAILQRLPEILRSIVTAVLQLAGMLVAPENLSLMLQAAIQLLLALVQALPTIIQAFAEALPSLIDSIIAFLTDPNTIQMMVAAGVQLMMALVTAVPQILGALLQAFGKLFRDMWSGLGKIFKDFAGNFGKGVGNAIINALNGAIGFIEGMINTPINIINGAIDVINGIPGVNIGHVQTISLGRIPTLATGGITTGPTNAIIGEAGREAVIPLEENTDWARIMAEEIDKQFDEEEGLGGRTVNIYMTNQINNKLDINEVSQELTTLIRRTI